MIDTAHNPPTLLGLQIIEEVFAHIGIAPWWEHHSVSLVSDTPWYVEIRISNPAITTRSVTIQVSDFGLSVDIMSWSETFEWAVQDYAIERAGIIDVLKTVLTGSMEVTRYGQSLAVLRFYRDGIMCYKRRILSGLCISPLRQSSRNSGPIVSLR